nr:multicopper oxidase domain-containing protein [Synechococcus sp. CCY 9618]
MNDCDGHRPWSRRRVLGLSAAGLGLAGLAGPLGGAMARSSSAAEIDGVPLPFDPTAGLRAFNHGRLIQEGGRAVRVFEVRARSLTLPLRRATRFKAWTLDGTVPGPSLRARVGERLRVIFHNDDSTSHSLHFHGVHPAAMDGIEPVLFNGSRTYEFDLPSAGLYPYHCHVAPVTRHVGKGLFGLLIVDPLQPRPPADELVLVMGGYDLRNEGHNDLYAFNGIPDHFHRQPIRIRQHQLVRLYLLNMVEFDGPLTFHIHANDFEILRQGSRGEFRERADVITLGVAERQILEFRYPFPGRYMFHPHQDQVAEKGCMGLFEVVAA